MVIRRDTSGLEHRSFTTTSSVLTGDASNIIGRNLVKTWILLEMTLQSTEDESSTIDKSISTSLSRASYPIDPAGSSFLRRSTFERPSKSSSAPLTLIVFWSLLDPSDFKNSLRDIHLSSISGPENVLWSKTKGMALFFLLVHLRKPSSSKK